MPAKPPAPNPCGSCPYRRDVPSGVWELEEYLKLPPYDNPTSEQPPAVFMCHRQDGHICAGWAGCHDMDENLGLRLGASMGTVEDPEAVRTYETTTELFASGAEAAAYGMDEIRNPGPEARRIMRKLAKRNA